MSEAANHVARIDELAEQEMRRLLNLRKDAIQAELVIDAEHRLETSGAAAEVHNYSISVYALAHATTILEHAFKTIRALEADIQAVEPLWRESA